MIFFPSSAVKIFPCSYRGIYDIQTEGDEASTKKLSKIFDPEARLTTEYNLTHLPGLAYGKDSYIISSEDNIWKFVINGYYFEINADLTDIEFEKFAIALHTSTFSSSQEDVRTTNRLVPLAVSTISDHKLTIDKSGNIGLDKAEITDGLTTYKCLAICAMTNQDSPDLSDIPQNIRFCYVNKADTLGSIEASMLSPIKVYADGLNTAMNTRVEALETTSTAHTEAIGDEKANREAADAELDSRLDVIQGSGDGSIAKALADAKTYAEGEATAAESAAKAYADGLAGNYDAAGAAAQVKLDVIGTAADEADDDTIKGAKAFVAAELEAAIGVPSAPAVGEPDDETGYVPAVEASGIHKVIEEALQDAKSELIGDDTDNTQASTIAGAKKYADGLVAKLTGQGGGDEGGDAPTITGLSLRVNGIDSRVSELEEVVNGVEASEGVEAVKGLVYRVTALEAGIVTMDAAYKEADEALDSRLDAVEAKLTNVTNVMDFRGAVAVLPDSTEGYQNGDVIVVTEGDNKGKEYVVSDGAFVEFGNTDANAAAISDIEGRLNVIEGSGDGSIAKALADAKKYAEDEADAAETAAKAYADSVAATAKSEAISEANGYTDGKVATLTAKDSEIEGKVTTLQQLTSGYTGEGAIKTAVDAAASAASAADSKAAAAQTRVGTLEKTLQDNYLSKTDVDGNKLGIYAVAFDLSQCSGDDLGDDFKAATSRPIVFISECSTLPSPPDNYAWFDSYGEEVTDITANIILYLKLKETSSPEEGSGDDTGEASTT